jgi:hypothetical protein
VSTHTGTAINGTAIRIRHGQIIEYRGGRDCQQGIGLILR